MQKYQTHTLPACRTGNVQKNQEKPLILQIKVHTKYGTNGAFWGINEARMGHEIAHSIIGNQ